MSKKDSGWWDDFFTPFRPVFGVVPRKATNAQVRAFIKMLGLRRGQKFLDCPCGIGRIAIPVAKVGIKVTGVDITESYLEELTKKAKKMRLKIELHHLDMRRVNFDSQFDAAANIWTSFGYFQKESDNLLVLKKMYKALKPGGKFLLHVINRDWLIANFQPEGWSEIGDTKLLEKRDFDYSSSTSITKWTVITDGKEIVCNSAIRMYSFHELIDMFNKIGFVDVEGFGSEKCEPITLTSRMMFVVGTKPGGKRK